MLNFSKLTGQIRSGAPFLETLREMLHPEVPFVKLILINSIVVSLLSLIIPVSIQSIITNLGILNLTQPIILMTFVLFIVLLFSGGIQTIQFYAIEILRRRLFIRFGKEILQRSTRYVDHDFQQVNRTQFSKRYTDVLLAQSSMVIFFADGIGFGIQYLLSIILLCLYHPYFLIFGLMITFLLWMSWILFGPKGVEAGTPEADARYDAMSWIDEVLRARPIFMTSRGREFAERKFIYFLDQWNNKRQNLFRQQFVQAISLQLINAVIYSALLSIGYMLVKRGELSIGQLVAAFVVVTMLLSTLPRLQNFYMSIYDYSTNLDKLAEFWLYPLENEKKSRVDYSHPYSIRLRDAEFSDRVKLNLTFEAGKKTYVYMKSFAAARMLTKAIEGFAKLHKGEIFVGEERYDDVSFSHLRDHLAVLAVGRFVATDIRDNLCGLTSEGVSLTELENALDKVGLLARVRELPDGLDTKLLPNGYPLSISESLALQVAKVIIQQPSLIIVTNDVEKLSSERKLLCLNYLLKESQATVIFLNQKEIDYQFDNYVFLERNFSKSCSSMSEVIKEVPNVSV